MSFAAIDPDELAGVTGAFGAGAAIGGGAQAVGQVISSMIETFGPLIWDTVSGGVGSLLQSIMYDGDAPVLDGILGSIKGSTDRIDGPMPVNAFSNGLQV